MESMISPYVGPRSFQTGETIYGRELEVREIFNLLSADRVVLIPHPSGAGTTSLMHSAIIPRLEKEGFWVLAGIRLNIPSPDPAMVLPAGFNPFVFSFIASIDMQNPPAQQHSMVELALMNLEEYLALRELERKDDPASIVLIIDQLESALAQIATHPAELTDFFTQLGAALHNEFRGALLITRDEQLAAMENYKRLFPNRLRSIFRVEQLTVAAAREAVVRPAAQAGVEYKADAVDQLLNNLRAIRVQQPDGSYRIAAGAYVEPLQIQVVCFQLWNKLPPGKKTITVEDVQALGDTDTALEEYFNNIVTLVARQTETRERQIRDWIQSQLITPQGLRGQVMRGEGSTQGMPNQVIQSLTNAYLVRADQRRGIVFYELAHDRLVGPILSSNQRWRMQNLHPFQLRAERWNLAGRPSYQLLERSEWGEVEQWVSAHPADLTSDEKEFLTFSQLALQQEDRAQAVTRMRMTNLEDLGWGVVFSASADPAVREAISELLDHRRAQATGKNAAFYHEFSGEQGYRQGETAQDFLRRNGSTKGPGNPANVPYYLLLVGDPEEIPFEFQYDLTTQFAVGRISFETLEEFSCYAQGIVASESGTHEAAKRAVFFSPSLPFARHIGETNKKVIDPLFEQTRQNFLNWEIQLLREDATRAALIDLLHEGGPALMIFSSMVEGVSKEKAFSFALTCQVPEDPGTPLSAEMYFSPSDIQTEMRLAGRVFYMYGSFTAGIPRESPLDLPLKPGRTPRIFAPKDALSPLAQALLSHPQGGALGLIGYVGPGMISSSLFENYHHSMAESLRRIMSGYTLGAALEPLVQQSLLIGGMLSRQIREVVFYGKPLSGEIILLDQVATSVRSFILLGDPAARLSIGG